MDKSCTICKKEFRDSSSLRRHTANKKPCEEVEVAQQWPCPNCNRPFSSKESQRRHLCNSPAASIRRIEEDKSVSENDIIFAF